MLLVEKRILQIYKLHTLDKKNGLFIALFTRLFTTSGELDYETELFKVILFIGTYLVLFFTPLRNTVISTVYMLLQFDIVRQ